MAESIKPNFTLRTLPEIKAVLPPTYWRRFSKPVPKEILRMLHPGSHVKVLAQSVGQPKNPCEEIWIHIRQVRKKGTAFVGLVNTHTGRSQYHGLEFGMMISFEAKHIIDVGMMGG